MIHHGTNKTVDVLRSQELRQLNKPFILQYPSRQLLTQGQAFFITDFQVRSKKPHII